MDLVISGTFFLSLFYGSISCCRSGGRREGERVENWSCWAVGHVSVILAVREREREREVMKVSLDTFVGWLCGEKKPTAVNGQGEQEEGQ